MSFSQFEYLKVEEPTQVQCPDWCSTECVVKKYSVTWKVDKTFEKNTLKSSPFNIGNLQSCLTMKAIDNNATKQWSLYFQVLARYNSFPHGKLLLKYEYNGAEQKHEIMIRADTFKQDRGWGFLVNVHSHNDRIKAKFECTIWHVGVDERMKNNSDHSPTLSANYLQLLKDEEFSDVTLKVNGGSLKAHKLILSSRSPVFAAMLKTDMKESKSGEIVIKDIEVAVMLILLRFIYSGSLDDNSELNKDLLLDLLKAAEKYDIPDLKVVCSEALKKIMNVDNVTQIRSDAALYNADKLRTEAELFIRQNMGAVSKTEDWKEMKKASPEEALKIIESVLCPVCKTLTS